MSLQSGNFYKTIQSVQSNITALQSSGSTIRSDISGVILKFQDLSGQVQVIDASMSEAFGEIETLDASMSELFLDISLNAPQTIIARAGTTFTITETNTDYVDPSFVLLLSNQTIDLVFPAGTYTYVTSARMTTAVGWNGYVSNITEFKTSLVSDISGAIQINEVNLGYPLNRINSPVFAFAYATGVFILNEPTQLRVSFKAVAPDVESVEITIDNINFEFIKT